MNADYKSQSAEDASKTNLRDDKIGELLKALKARMTDPSGGKVKGNITVTFDCCFSGTATRGIPPSGRLVHRGRGWDPQIDGPPARQGVPGNERRGEWTSRGGRGILRGLGRADRDPEQSDRQGVAGRDRPKDGSVHSLLDPRARKATPNTTYRDIFERVNADLLASVPDQAPSIEGDERNLLFSGTAVPVDPYLVVNDYDRAGTSSPFASASSRVRPSAPASTLPCEQRREGA